MIIMHERERGKKCVESHENSGGRKPISLAPPRVTHPASTGQPKRPGLIDTCINSTCLNIIVSKIGVYTQEAIA